jgi:hypothetical protein
VRGRFALTRDEMEKAEKRKVHCSSKCQKANWHYWHNKLGVQP